MRFVLASSSPRRLDLLTQVGLVPDAVNAPSIDEATRPRELPQDLAIRLAIDKATAIAKVERNAVVLGADTVVARGRRILPKAADAREARAELELLSGHRHRVYGGIAVVASDSHGQQHVWRRLVVTSVKFKRLSSGEIDQYVASGEWTGKAGSYAIQGLAALFVESIHGSYFNVVGLCVLSASRLLTRAFALAKQ